MPTGPARTVVACAALCVLAACGQKGPPLAPLHLVPAPVSELGVRRVDDRVRLRFVLPTRNANGPGPIDLDRVEIYAVTIAPGAPPPPNRDLLSKAYLVGEVAVRPAPVEGETPKEGDTRPEPGAAVTFDEQLDAAKLTPVAFKAPAAPAAPAPDATATPPAASIPTLVEGPPAILPGAPLPPATIPAEPGQPATAEPAPAQPAPPAQPTPAGQPPATREPAAVDQPPAAGAPAAAKPQPPPPPKFPARVYAVRGVTKSGRFGPPSTRIEVLLIPVPSPPTAVASRVTESAVVIEWKPPTEPPLPLSYNVYEAGDPMQPINTAPIAAVAFEHTAAKFGEEHCYRMRGITVAGATAVLTEGAMSEETCVTPRDVFAPAAPKRLDAVPTPGQISLIWEANTEKDLAGYIVLRGDAPDGTLQPLTPEPIRDTSYRDTTVKPGVRYIYAVVAVDTATPPNTSAQSPRVEETAR